MKDVLTRLTRELPRFEKLDFKRPSGFDTKIAAEGPISYQSRLCLQLREKNELALIRLACLKNVLNK
jgi:hypothetical protein